MKTHPRWYMPLAIALVPLSGAFPLNSEEHPGPSTGEIELLEEIVDVREVSLERQKLLYEEGRIADISKAKLAVFLAKSELAMAKGDLVGAIAQRKNAEELHERLLKSFELEFELGTLKSEQLAEAKIQFLKARLERVRLEAALSAEKEK